jgi:hypothetical protein
MRNLNETIFLLRSGNSMKRKKPLSGSQTQEIHYPKTKLVTRHSYSYNPM